MDRRGDIVVWLEQEREKESQGAGMSSKFLVEEEEAGEQEKRGWVECDRKRH